MSTCLVTGGAGFIGCAISHRLLGQFDRVVVLDNLHPQVHPTAERPAALAEGAELRIGDVTAPEAWDEVLTDVSPDVVVHLAAETGTGQSLTEASRHGLVNVVGTTQLLDALVRHDALPKSIVLTSSRAVYGEGAWRGADGALVYPGQRSRAMLEDGQWDFPGLTAQPFNSRTTEPRPTSVYGSTKLAQEHILSSWCLAMGVEPIVYRLQNVYGPGQSLTNPYTGIVSLFTQKAKAGEIIPVYEDGNIIRDFVFIDDVADAILRGIARGQRNEYAFDIGSGQATSVLQLAQIAAAHYGAPDPQINGMYRDGDVRHASCTIDESRAELDWTPAVNVQEGVRRLSDWIDGRS